MATENTFQPTWAIVELFGHQKIAGQVSEQTIGGTSFIRVDVPETDDSPAFTRTFHGNAVYAFNWTTEETARAEAKRIKAQPINLFDLREAAQKLVDQKIQEGRLQLVEPKEVLEDRDPDDDEWGGESDDNDQPY